MERQCARVDTKECFATQHFNAPVLEVERIVRSDSFGFEDRLIIKIVSDREIGHSSNAG